MQFFTSRTCPFLTIRHKWPNPKCRRRTSSNFIEQLRPTLVIYLTQQRASLTVVIVSSIRTRNYAFIPKARFWRNIGVGISKTIAFETFISIAGYCAKVMVLHVKGTYLIPWVPPQRSSALIDARWRISWG